MKTCSKTSCSTVILVWMLLCTPNYSFCLRTVASRLPTKTARSTKQVDHLPNPPRLHPLMTATRKLSSTLSASSLPSQQTLVDVYPYGTCKDALLRQQKTSDNTSEGPMYTRTKVVHFIRHAQGTHNVNKEYRDVRHIDARLTEHGEKQCQTLAQAIQQHKDSDTSETVKHNLASVLHDTELIVTSPLTRCIQTTLLTMDPVIATRDVPIVAHENIRETVNFNCDRRRHLSEVAQDFPQINFGHMIHDHDAIWESYQERLGSHEEFLDHRESAELHVVADRGRDFLQWLAQQDQDHVVICSHCAYSRCLLNFGHEGKPPTSVEQALDTRGPDAIDVPVVRYCGDQDDFEDSIRKDFDNCELRSVVLAFRSV